MAFFIAPNLSRRIRFALKKFQFADASRKGILPGGVLLRQVAAVAIFGLFASAASAEVISRVEIEGNRRIERDTILIPTSSRTGTPLSQDSVSTDVKQIYRLGFFENVGAEVRRGDGATVLVFRVREKPSIRNVFLEGNDSIGDDTLKEKLDIGARRFLDRKKIRAALEQLTDFYRSQGYYDVGLDFREAEVGNNEVDVTISVTEGKKVYIQEIVFEGAEQIESDELEDVVRTSSYNWWLTWITGSGVLKKEELSADSKELIRYYLNKGHVDVRIPEPEVTRIEEGLRVTYKITEGPVYTLGNVRATGDLVAGDQSKTLEGIDSSEGEIFNADALRKDTFTISEKFTDVGYAFANVSPDTEINREQKTVGINFQIDRGKEVYVDRINIVGNSKTRDNVVRRSLQIEEQEKFSSSKIRKSQEYLQRLGYFDEVTITPEPAPDQGRVNLNVGVREANTGSFSAGAGVSSGDGFIFSTQITENNIFGTGNRVSLDLNNGTRRDTYVLSFDNPRVNDTYLSWGVDASAYDRVYNNFDRGQVGGSTTFGYPLWFLGEAYLEDIRGSVTYELMSVKIDNINADAPTFVRESEGDTVVSSVTPKLTRNTINNPLDPTAGSRQMLGVEIAGAGGDEEFWVAQAANTFYYDLFDSPIGKFIFSNRVRFDYGDTFDGEDRLPLFRRFFPGGINSVRGYDPREMGPKENGREFGGSKQLVFNFDLIFPIADSIGLKGVTFYDAGQAFDDEDNISVGDLRQAIGWGIRWRSPIAPIRIEIGYPLDKEDGDRSVVTNFSFGSPQ